MTWLVFYVQVPVMKAPKVEYDESPIPCPNEKIFLLQDSSSLPQAQNLEASNVNKEKVWKQIQL